MRIVSIDSIEGNHQRLDGGAMFGNVPKAVWSRWVTPDDQNRIPLACRSLILTLDDGRRILFEAGIGAFFEPALRERYGVLESEHCLLNNLQSMGISQDSIDVVILSHLHFDHAGGLLTPWQQDEPSQLLFPNAEYWVGSEQWQRACHSHSRDRASYIPELNALLKQSERLRLIEEGGDHPLQALVSFTFSNGHTPGLMLSHIKTDSGPLVFCSDLVPGEFWTHVPVSMGYDRYPELLINEKKGLLDELLYKGGTLFFTHDVNMCAGRVHRNDKGRFYVSEQSIKKLINSY